MIRFLVFIILFCPIAVFAHSKKCSEHSHKDSPWHGTSAKFGAVINTGNTNTSQYNAGGTLDYTKNRWNNVTVTNWQFGKSEGEVNQEKYFIQNELNYGLDPTRKKYLFQTASYTEDKFSPYKYQLLIAAGFGFHLWRTDRFSLRFQFGPGYRRDEVDGTDEVHDQIVATTRTTMKWQMTKNSNFRQIVQYDIGSQYNYLKTVSVVTNKVTGHIAIQLSYVVENYSRIPLGSSNTEKTDTTTNIAVVYNF